MSTSDRAKTQTFTYGDQLVTLETGRLAPRADAAVTARHGNAMVLAAVTVGTTAREGLDFVPLTVDYHERRSAVGKVPNNFHRREVRAGEEELLTSRLIDRATRPLIQRQFRHEIQLTVTVFGADAASDLTLLALLASQAAVLAAPHVPTSGMAAAARVVIKGGDERIFASVKRRAAADINVLATGDVHGITALEAAAQNVADGEVAAVMVRAAEVVAEQAAQMAAFVGGIAQDDGATATAAESGPSDPVKDALRSGQRPDDRALTELRALDAEVGLVAATHGSAMFRRGDTQALATVTLGQSDDARVIDGLMGRSTRHFMVHYNFPSFAVGEVGSPRGPGRREIGHGTLARRAIDPVIPSRVDLPWVVRVVADILSSDGSSSMATVCATSLALMDAGVQIAAPVAGIAMGVVATAAGDAVLTDIRASEDAAGDMDFKIAGTRAGLTALQLDNKRGAIPVDTLTRALVQGRSALDALLDRMDETLATPREAVAAHAPQVTQMRVAKRHVGRLIGPGGKTVQGIQKRTRTRIDVRDDGRIRISAKNAEDLRRALVAIEEETADLRQGEIYEAEVVTLKDYGAFVRIGAHEGLVHVSELEDGRTENVGDVVSEGAKITVRVQGVDERGRLVLSRRAAIA